MLDDIWTGTPYEELLKGTTFEELNSGSHFGDPDNSRVSPTGTTTHHDMEAYDEYTAKVNPPKDFEDPNNSYQKVGAAMNHIDERWGENFEEPFGPPHHSHHHPTHAVNPIDPPHHHPDRVVIDTPPMQQFTPADVEEVYGYTEHNMHLLTVSSVRIAKLTQVLNALQDQSKGIDLVRIMEQVPFASTSFREVLETAFGIEMQNYLAIVEKLNEYIYGQPSPEPEPVDLEPDPEQPGQESEPTQEQTEQNETTETSQNENPTTETTETNTDNPIVFDTDTDTSPNEG